MHTRILIVDDEPTNIAVIENILEGQNLEYKSASNGLTAIDVATQFNPDIILLDVMMPDINGYEVCQRIKSHPQLKFVKVVFVSAKGLKEDRLKGYEVGSNDYISKPFDPDELLAKIKSMEQLRYGKELEVLKNNVLKIMSHEIRTPLNGVLGFASLISQSTSLIEQDRMFLNKVIDSGNKLLTLSEKYMLLFELRNKPLLSLEKTTLDVLCDRAVKNLSLLAEKKKSVFSCQSICSSPILVDTQLMQKGIDIIVDYVSQLLEASVKIDIACQKEKDFCQLSIRLESDQNPSLFKAMNLNEGYGAELIHSTHFQLDLLLVKMILEVHQGSLLINFSNHHVVFTLTFPLHTPIAVSSW